MEDIVFGMIGWMKTDTNDKIWGWCTDKRFVHPNNEPRSPRMMPYDGAYIQFRIDRNFSSWQADAPAYTFWGRRLGPISFKTVLIDSELEKLMDQKLKKGYKYIDKETLDSESPDFNNNFDLAFVMHKLKQPTT
jgi:hypothetical protein